MAIKFLNPTPAWNGVSAGAMATLDLEINRPRYWMLWLRVSTTVTSAVPTTIAGFLGETRLKIDGTPQRTRTALEINRINLLNDPNAGAFITRDDLVAATDPNEVVSKVKADGTFTVALTATSTFKYTLHLPYLFAEGYRKEYLATAIMAFPTAFPGGKRGMGSLQLEADIPSTLQNPALTSDWYGDTLPGVLDAQGNPFVRLSKWYRKNYPFTASGNLPMKMNWAGRYQDLHIVFATSTPQTTAGDILLESAGIPTIIKSNSGRLNMLNHGLAIDAFNTLYLPNWASICLDSDDDPNSGIIVGLGDEFTLTPNIVAVKTATPTTITAGNATLLATIYGARD